MIRWLNDQWYDHRGLCIAFIAIFCIIGGGSAFVFYQAKQPQPVPQTKVEHALSEAKKPTHLYAGHWYSDRDDGSELVLHKDGTFDGTGWVNSGKYKFVNDIKIELKDQYDGTKYLQLKTVNDETALYDAIGKHYFYSSKKLLQEAQAQAAASKVDNKKLVDQKWSDVLTKGAWIKDAGQSADVEKLEFTATQIIEHYKNGKTVKHNYYVDSKNQNKSDESEAFIYIQLDRQYKNTLADKSLVIKDTGSKYTLSTDMTFGNEDFHKSYDAVTLTQSGNTEDDGKNGNTTQTSEDESGDEVTTQTTVTTEDGWK